MRPLPAPRRQLEGGAAAPPPPAVGGLYFVPARWVLALLALVRLIVKGRGVSTLGIAGLVWLLTPRKLKLAAVGLAAAATIVFLGALAAIALLVLQLA
jgi:hypothetical protein